MYRNLLTPSFVQCGGIDGNVAEDVECNLATNTAISNGLKALSTYFLSVRLQSAGDGKPPVFTYFTLTATKLPEAVTGTLDLTNQTSIIGLGHVVSQEEVTTSQRDSSTQFKVIIAHNDWDTEVCVVFAIYPWPFPPSSQLE
jgi:hypothetical protein